MALLGTLTDHLRRANPLVADPLVAIGFASMALGYDHLDEGTRGERVSMAPLGTARGAGAR